MTVEESGDGRFFADRDQFQTRIKWVYELFLRLLERPYSTCRAPCPAASSRCWRWSRADEPAASAAADEPSLGLAPIIIQQIFNTGDSCAEGMTIFFVEQNANQALKL